MMIQIEPQCIENEVGPSMNNESNSSSDTSKRGATADTSIISRWECERRTPNGSRSPDIEKWSKSVRLARWAVTGSERPKKKSFSLVRRSRFGSQEISPGSFAKHKDKSQRRNMTQPTIQDIKKGNRFPNCSNENQKNYST